MKRTFRLIVLLLCFWLSGFTELNAGTIIVNIEGLSTSKGGKVYTAVFLRSNFLKTGQHLFGDIKPVTANRAVVVFDNVPAGSYGIAIFQDVDGSEDLSKNMLGIPKEPMGFSRNPKITFGPPDFDDVKITIGENETLEISIRIK